MFNNCFKDKVNKYNIMKCLLQILGHRVCSNLIWRAVRRHQDLQGIIALTWKWFLLKLVFKDLFMKCVNRGLFEIHSRLCFPELRYQLGWTILIHVTAHYNELSFSAVVFSSLNTNLWRFDSKSRNNFFCSSSSGNAPILWESSNSPRSC